MSGHQDRSSLAIAAGRRWPRGRVGASHQTRGSNLLAVLHVTSGSLAVGPEISARLAGVRADGWYPVTWLLELLDELELSGGSLGLRQVGRQIFRATHADWTRQTCSSARDLFQGLDDMYRCGNRGEEIGGWDMLELAPGRAMLVKNTPHHCEMEEGILSEALLAVGVPATVTQPECVRKGATSCTFLISSAFVRREWNGERIA